MIVERHEGSELLQIMELLLLELYEVLELTDFLVNQIDVLSN